MDQVRDVIRLKHYSYRTEQTYVQWVRRFILFHNKRHPQEMGVAEIEAFLTFWLPLDGGKLELCHQETRKALSPWLLN